VSVGQEVHFWDLPVFRIFFGVLVFPQIVECYSIHYRGRVRCSSKLLLSALLDHIHHEWLWCGVYPCSTSMWQHQCHKCCKEPSAPFQNQAHRSEISFSERQRREREDGLDPCTHTLQTSRYFHQTPRSSNFHSFAGGAWCVSDFLSWVCGSSFVAYVSFPLRISCIWHGICNVMYRHRCILDCMHFVSYALVRKSFSYIHCSPWTDMYVFVSLFGKLWLVWLSSW
jgi:hypothetical protein